MPLVTRAQLAKVAPHGTSSIVSAIVDHADTILPRYGLATTARLTDFLAHVLVESGYLTRVDENLDYSAERLHAVWPTRFPTIASAAPYAHNPKALANKVYGGRMGNVGPDDGWLNRGQGLIETTGHDNIARLAAHLDRPIDDILAMLVSEAGMLECAAATYVMLGAPAWADKGDIVGTTRAINGGTNGLADRRAMLALCRKIWPRVTPPAAPVSHFVTQLSPSAPQKGPPMSKSALLLAAVLAIFGLSVSAAQAGSIDLTQAMTAGVDYLIVPLLMAVAPTVAALLVMPLRRYLDQQAGETLARRVNDVLDKAIAFAAQQGVDWISREDFHANVDGWVASIAADYANSHAPALIKQAGGVLSEKIAARLGSHEDLLALKSMAAVNDNSAAATNDSAKAA